MQSSEESNEYSNTNPQESWKLWGAELAIPHELIDEMTIVYTFEMIFLRLPFSKNRYSADHNVYLKDSAIIMMNTAPINFGQEAISTNSRI